MLNYFPEDVFDRIKAKYESILKFLTWSFALCADGHFEHELQEHAACPVWDVKCWAPVGQAHIGGVFLNLKKCWNAVATLVYVTLVEPFWTQKYLLRDYSRITTFLQDLGEISYIVFLYSKFLIPLWQHTTKHGERKMKIYLSVHFSFFWNEKEILHPMRRKSSNNQFF